MSARAEQKLTLQPPTGTVTFLFSDIEGSTRLLDRLGDRYPAVLQRHRQAMRDAFTAHDGVERGTEGDSFFVAFADADAAVAAAADAARNLAAAEWPEGGIVRVRIGLHTGEGRLVDGDYVGMDVHRAARIAAAGHGGQVLLSQSTEILAERSLPAGVSLRDMGEHRLKDLPAPEHLYQLVIEGQSRDFPPLRSLARTVVNLPGQLASIVGREDDLTKVRDLLGRSRLVTVSGPGGTGKTRLVQEIAREIVADDPTNVVFVPLDALTDANLIPIEILRALRLDIAAARDPIDRLVEHLAERATLSHRRPGAARRGRARRAFAVRPRADGLGPRFEPGGAARLRRAGICTASAAGLVGTMPAEARRLGGGPESPATALFVERARAVRADFVLDSLECRGGGLAICTRLDGLPLAIELAAAQVGWALTGSDPAAVGGRSIRWRAVARIVPARQEDAAGDPPWSCESWARHEQRLFRRLVSFLGRRPATGGRGDRRGSVAGLGIPWMFSARWSIGAWSACAIPWGTKPFAPARDHATYARELAARTRRERGRPRKHAHIYEALARRGRTASSTGGSAVPGSIGSRPTETVGRPSRNSRRPGSSPRRWSSPRTSGGTGHSADTLPKASNASITSSRLPMPRVRPQFRRPP